MEIESVLGEGILAEASSFPRPKSAVELLTELLTVPVPLCKRLWDRLPENLFKKDILGHSLEYIAIICNNKKGFRMSSVRLWGMSR